MSTLCEGRRFAGKVAIVTGGTQGIGRATVGVLAADGASVSFCAREPRRIATTVAELEKACGEVLGFPADVTSAGDIERFVDATIESFGRVDILVNNAGVSSAETFSAVDDAEWQADFDLKVFGAIRMCRLVIPFMRKQGHGRIINITTPGGKTPRAGSLPTSVSRAAGLALTKVLSHELAPDGILVNTVCVGSIRSAQNEARAQSLGITVDEHYANHAATIPLGRVGEAVEVANVVAFLASEEASYVTGTSINVDGGRSSVL